MTKSLKLKFPWKQTEVHETNNPRRKQSRFGETEHFWCTQPLPTQRGGCKSEENTVLWTQQSQWSGSSRPQRDTGILHWRWGRRGGKNCCTFCFFSASFPFFLWIVVKIEAQQMRNKCLEHKTAEFSTCSSHSFIKFSYHSPCQD